jgi:hypothetical protein
VTIAHADIINFNLSIGNAAISGFTGPYAQVTIDLTSSTTADLTFTSLTNSGNIYLMGDGGTADVNVNATTWILSGLAGSNAGTGFTPGPYSDGGSGNISSFGVFNQTINSFDGYTHSSDTISFTLTNTSATWLDAASVLATNADGNVAALHVFVTSSPADASNGAIVTGFASGDETGGGGGGGGSVPEPGTIVLLGSGLLVTFAKLRKKLVRS